MAMVAQEDKQLGTLDTFDDLLLDGRQRYWWRPDGRLHAAPPQIQSGRCRILPQRAEYSTGALVVAPLFERSFAMFASVLGTWIPFALIFLSTYLVGWYLQAQVMHQQNAESGRASTH
jgi:hypothetical protein